MISVIFLCRVSPRATPTTLSIWLSDEMPSEAWAPASSGISPSAVRASCASFVYSQVRNNSAAALCGAWFISPWIGTVTLIEKLNGAASLGQSDTGHRWAARRARCRPGRPPAIGNAVCR